MKRRIEADVKGMRVMLTEGSGRQALPMSEALTRLGCAVVTVNASRLDPGYASRYPREKLVVPGVDQDETLAREVFLRTIRDRGIDLVIPLSDFSARIMAEEKPRLEPLVQVATADEATFMRAFDKAQTMRLCKEAGIPCPDTYDGAEAAAHPERVRYPVVVKPRSSWGSIGFHVAENPEELRRALQQAKRYGPALVQERLPGNSRQLNVQMVMDAKQSVKTALVTEKCRWFPLDGGAATLCRTLRDPRAAEICAQLLRAMKWTGYCDVDMMVPPSDGIPRVIEVNGRISANVKLCFLAGVDVARQILQQAQGLPVTFCPDYSEDVRLRCLHTDLLWLMKSPERFGGRPIWFSPRRTHDQMFSLRDPLPFAAFTVQALCKYRSAMRMRER